MFIKSFKPALCTLLIILFLPIAIFAQSNSLGQIFNTEFLILVALILVVVVVAMLRKSMGKKPAYVSGPYTALRRGYNIKLKGEAKPKVQELITNTFAIQPKNFPGLSPIPKVVVNPGDEVKAGDEIFFDKKNPEVKHVSPVSGEVSEIVRGEKRSIKEIVILADKTQEYRSLPAIDLNSITREALVNFLLEYGAWPLIKQRPYGLIANHRQVPANIFVSTFDTAPLAPDSNIIIKGSETAFQAGIKVLSKLTEGAVFLGLNANGKEAPAEVFQSVEGAEKHWFKGPHPAGNVGVHIHHIKPVNAKDVAWTLGVQEVITLGKMITEKKFDATRIVAIVGDVSNPGYVRTILGANLKDLVKDQDAEDKRLISGDVLSGQAKKPESYLNYYDDQITVLKEGDYFEMFGWLLPGKSRPSVSRTFTNFLTPKKRFTPDTNTHGEKRAFVVTGQYEDLMPMDVYPQHLMKSILVNDFERMEGLGIYELTEEDVALCEFACTSKQPLQSILREGLDLMREQG